MRKNGCEHLSRSPDNCHATEDERRQLKRKMWIKSIFFSCPAFVCWLLFAYTFYGRRYLRDGNDARRILLFAWDRHESTRSTNVMRRKSRARRNHNYYYVFAPLLLLLFPSLFLLPFLHFARFVSFRYVWVQTKFKLSGGKNAAEPKMNYYVSLERRGAPVFSHIPRTPYTETKRRE